jgi:hypothetical protein
VERRGNGGGAGVPAAGRVGAAGRDPARDRNDQRCSRRGGGGGGGGGTGRRRVECAQVWWEMAGYETGEESCRGLHETGAAVYSRAAVYTRPRFTRDTGRGLHATGAAVYTRSRVKTRPTCAAGAVPPCTTSGHGPARMTPPGSCCRAVPACRRYGRRDAVGLRRVQQRECGVSGTRRGSRVARRVPHGEGRARVR